MSEIRTLVECPNCKNVVPAMKGEPTEPIPHAIGPDANIVCDGYHTKYLGPVDERTKLILGY